MYMPKINHSAPTRSEVPMVSIWPETWWVMWSRYDLKKEAGVSGRKDNTREKLWDSTRASLADMFKNISLLKKMQSVSVSNYNIQVIESTLATQATAVEVLISLELQELCPNPWIALLH